MRKAALLEAIWNATPAAERAVHRHRRYVALYSHTPLVDLSYGELRKLAAVVRGDARQRHQANRSATRSIMPFRFSPGVRVRDGAGERGDGTVLRRERTNIGDNYLIAWDRGDRSAITADRLVHVQTHGRGLAEDERRAAFDAKFIAAPDELAALQATPEGRRILAARADHNRRHWARLDVLGFDPNQPHCMKKRCACPLPHFWNQNVEASDAELLARHPFPRPAAANRAAPAPAGRRILRLPRGLDRRTALAYIAEGHAGRQPDFRGFTYNPTTGRAALV